MGGTARFERALRGVGRGLTGRALHRVALVLVVWAVLLVPAIGPAAPQPARADAGVRVSTVDPRAPHTAVCSATRRVDCSARLTFPVGDLVRRVYVYLPPAAARGPVTLVVAVHGLRMTPRSLDDTLGLTGLARREGFAVALPQGYGEQDGARGYQAGWNAGSCCGPAARDQVDDVAMMEATVTAAKTLFASNGRVYYLGFSNGAMLGYRLWCEGGGPFRAFVAVHGTLTVPSCSPATTRPFLAVHALRDTTVPYAGCARSQRASSCARVLYTDLPSGRTTIYAMRRAAGCTGAVARRYAPHVILSDSTGCRRPGPTHMTIDNAGHNWVSDKYRNGVNETAQAWGFLRRR
jgi:polyhydroxybutyrate depolymerase